MMGNLVMDSTPIKVRVVRPCWIRGVPVEKGTVYELPRSEALAAVEAGRVELVQWDERD